MLDCVHVNSLFKPNADICVFFILLVWWLVYLLQSLFSARAIFYMLMVES